VGLKSPPSVVQLPGGIKLQSIYFRIVERFDNGSPKLFEILPPGTHQIGDDIYVLWAIEEHVRSDQRKKR